MTTSARPVAIVTGGRRGIGLGIAKALAAEGFDIAITGIGDSDAATDTMLGELTALGGRAIYLKGDLAMQRPSRPSRTGSAPSAASSTTPASPPSCAAISSIFHRSISTRSSPPTCAAPSSSPRPC
jgi:NAD(P)-dependent dehydrogenase (short-subunit alcohol dehydrogenase family)